MRKQRKFPRASGCSGNFLYEANPPDGNTGGWPATSSGKVLPKAAGFRGFILMNRISKSLKIYLLTSSFTEVARPARPWISEGMMIFVA